MIQRLKLFFNVFDSRFEDLDRSSWKSILYRDFSAGLITAMTAIPMAMGFAMASGLRPEQGIIAGALACIIGRTFGGSKYQVYGPTAAFIPLIYSIMQSYNHSFLVLVSVIAGIILMLLGVFGLGKIAKAVPNSVIVGFTVGIAATIALTNSGDALGLKEALSGTLLQKISAIFAQIGSVNYYAVGIAAMTFILCKVLLRISIFIPAPLIAIGAATLVGNTLFSNAGIQLVRDRYGSIPTNFFAFTPPSLPALNAQVLGDIAYFVFAIVFISGVESLLCSSMADRLANNKKTPFNPDKEFWGQGLVQIITPLINGFPCTGALARTATSIKAGAMTPFAGYFKGVLKLGMAYCIASYLEMVPLACIGGILLWVASNMIKTHEIREVLSMRSPLHSFLLAYTAIMVPMTDFLTGVLSALIIYGVAVAAKNVLKLSPMKVETE